MINCARSTIRDCFFSRVLRNLCTRCPVLSAHQETRWFRTQKISLTCRNANAFDRFFSTNPHTPVPGKSQLTTHLYTRSHEFLRLRQGGKPNIVEVGLSTYAIEQLGDVVFLETLQTGMHVNRGDTLATVEATKSVAEVYSPVTGTIVEINRLLQDESGLIALNRNPEGNGWLAALEVSQGLVDEIHSIASSPSPSNDLLTSNDYTEFCALQDPEETKNTHAQEG